MMDPDYVLFTRVVAAGSLSAAGRELGISPAMMSKRMARLEARIGVPLLHRTTRHLALTRAGESLHHDIVGILRAIEEAERRATLGHRAPAGPLKISAPTSFGRLHVAPHMDRFLRAYPQVELELDLSDAYANLTAERIDVAIRIADHVAPGLTAHHLAANHRILCASPAYLAAHGSPRRVGELTQHRLLAADGQLPWRLANGRRRTSIDGRSYVRTNSSEIVRELALAGVGIALRSSWDVGDAVDRGALVPVLPSWTGLRDTVVQAVHPVMAAQPAAAAAFIDFMRDRFADAPWNVASPSPTGPPPATP